MPCWCNWRFIYRVGLAKGYLNDEKKTNEAFVSHPDFGLIYKTGDCGKMHSEGYIEFLGRQDYQVKIQGISSRVRRNLIVF